jgi:GntR family transcriptional regulator
MLNPASPVPLYRQLADALGAQVREGALKAGDRLPSEPELARKHGIGRPTVRQATDLLVQQGLIERRRGAGTFVRPQAKHVDFSSLAGTLSSFRDSGLDLKTKLLRRVAQSRIPESSADNPFAGRGAWTFVRLGSLASTPVLLEHVYLDPLVFPNLHQAKLAGASLAETVKSRYFLEPEAGQQTFHVTVPDAEVRSALAIGARQAVLLIRRSLDFPRAPRALFVEAYCNTDHVTFSQHLGANPR